MGLSEGIGWDPPPPRRKRLASSSVDSWISGLAVAFVLPRHGHPGSTDSIKREAPQTRGFSSGRPDLKRGPLVCRLDRAEQAVLLVVNSGSEQERVRVAGDAVAEAQSPQPIDLDRATVLVPETPEEFAGCAVIGVDATVPEVPDQQGATEAAEASGCAD